MDGVVHVVHSGASHNREGHSDRDATFLILVGLQATAGSACSCRLTAVHTVCPSHHLASDAVPHQVIVCR